MLALAFMAGAAVLFNTAPAKANVSVTYGTSGTFQGGNGPVVASSIATVVQVSPAGTATLTITATGTVSAPGSPPGAGASFGTITATSTGAGATFTNVGFKLTIAQTVPLPTGGTISFTDTLNGTVTSQNNTIVLTFSSPLTKNIPFSGGVVHYTVQQQYVLVSPSTGIPGFPVTNGVTSLQGTITATVTPEPGALALALTGLPLIGLAAWRRTRKNAI